MSGRVGDGKSFFSVFQDLWREEGLRGMYKGVSARMFYMGCNSFVMIGAYEVSYSVGNNPAGFEFDSHCL